MKKAMVILCITAMLAAFTACDNKGGVPESSTENSAPESASESSTESPAPESAAENIGSAEDPESTPASTDAPESEIPEENKGEPTFLTCVDGTVIRTSDITSIRDSEGDADGNAEQIPIETFNEENFINNAYIVTCEGFAYAFTSTPDNSFNPVQDPDKFEAYEGGVYEYIGENIAPSGEYYRVEAGDKFGELTVKNAVTEFFANYADYRNKGINGAYQYGGKLEFEGELELTGYVQVSEENEGYDEGGEIRFVPDNECVDKIPVMKYEVNEENGEIQHCPIGNWDSNAHNDVNRFSLGNIYDYDIDLDGLEPGERMTHVKITIGDIFSEGSAYFAEIDAKLLALEKI